MEHSDKATAKQEPTIIEEWDMYAIKVLDDRELTPAQKTVGVRLGLYWNAKDGRCDPSYDTMAEALNLSRSTVAEAIKALKRRGHINHDRRGYNSNSYALNGVTPKRLRVVGGNSD